MASKGKIVAFCCNYVTSVPAEALQEGGLVPDGFEIRRLPCTGKLEVKALLDAFTEGAQAVFVAGCKIDKCHNSSGSYRAAKRVKYAKTILEELSIPPERLEMIFVDRGATGPVVETANAMEERLGSQKAAEEMAS